MTTHNVKSLLLPAVSTDVLVFPSLFSSAWIVCLWSFPLHSGYNLSFSPSSAASSHWLPFSCSFAMKSLSYCTAAPLQCLPQFASFFDVQCQLRPPDQILTADDCFHPLFSCPAFVKQPPCFPQFFASAGVVAACVCWSVCCVGLSLVCCQGLGNRWCATFSPAEGEFYKVHHCAKWVLLHKFLLHRVIFEKKKIITTLLYTIYNFLFWFLYSVVFLTCLSYLLY